MADFEVTGESSACGVSNRIVGITFRYREGSLVYSLAKARRGELERIAIKKVRIIANRATYNQTVISYVDTTNRIWFEEELCAESVAVAAAMQFLERRRANIISELENCNY